MRLALLALAALTAAPVLAQPTALRYPDSRRDASVVDDYHGTRVADPYRWLEDPDAPETQAWIDAQSRFTRAYLDALPGRQAFVDRLTQLFNYERYSTPDRAGNRFFFSKNDGLQNQSVLYWQEGLRGTPRVLIDPNTLSADGTVSVAGLYPSENGRYVAYMTSDGGSDWRTIRVRRVGSPSSVDTDDVVRWVKFSGLAWAKDGSGFYYSAYDAPADGRESLSRVNENQKVFFHRLGTPQSADRLVYARPDQPRLNLGASVTDDGRYLVLTANNGTDVRNGVWIKDLRGGQDAPARPLFDAFDASYDVVGNRGTTFYVLTNKDAPQYRLVAVDLNRPGTLRTLIAESRATLQSVQYTGSRFVATALEDVKSRITVHDRTGRLVRTIALPTAGSAGVATEYGRSDAFLSFTSFTYPSTQYRLDLNTGRLTPFRRPNVAFRPEDYEVEQVFYPSKDGTRIPMYVVSKKGTPRDGTTPTYLYAYGGFNISSVPGFSTSTIAWLDRGGRYAVANLRGGGEYGEAWHQAGMLDRKQNVFDDFHAAAEYLVANRYTSSRALGIGGGSNGGLLVGAAMTQRPDLYGAAIPAVGVLDMLRYHTFTIGWAWVPEYGSSADPAQFRTLYAYSPLHNLRPAAYPPTLVMTADRDDRVVPAHSFKFTAELQRVQQGPNPALIRIETRAGHGAGTPVAKTIQTEADRWAFLWRHLSD